MRVKFSTLKALLAVLVIFALVSSLTCGLGLSAGIVSLFFPTGSLNGVPGTSYISFLPNGGGAPDQGGGGGDEADFLGNDPKEKVKGQDNAKGNGKPMIKTRSSDASSQRDRPMPAPLTEPRLL